MAGLSAFGTMLFIHLTPPLPVTLADDINDIFRVAGDWRPYFLDGNGLRVVGSTANDGNYTCDGNATYDVGGDYTAIAVNEALTDNTADGNIERCPAITHVTNIGGPALSLDVADVTAHDSTDAFEEAVPTIIRSGEVSFDINFDPADPLHNEDLGLLEQLTDRDLRLFELILPTTPVDIMSFYGYLVGFEPSAPHEDKLAAAVRIKPTGVVTT